MFIPGSRILIFAHPGFRIQKQQQKRDVKKVCCHTFFRSHKFPKIENYFIFDLLKNKTFYSKNCHQALKNMGLGSGIGEKHIPDPRPGVKKALDPGSRIRIRNTDF